MSYFASSLWGQQENAKKSQRSEHKKSNGKAANVDVADHRNKLPIDSSMSTPVSAQIVMTEGQKKREQSAHADSHMRTAVDTTDQPYDSDLRYSAGPDEPKPVKKSVEDLELQLSRKDTELKALKDELANQKVLDGRTIRHLRNQYDDLRANTVGEPRTLRSASLQYHELQERFETVSEALKEANDKYRNLAKGYVQLQQKLKLATKKNLAAATDTRVQAAYNKFCTTVERWVDTQVDDAEKFLQEVWFREWKNDDCKNAIIFAIAGQKLLNVLEANPDVEVYLTQLLIFGLLHHLVLDTGERFLGLHSDIERFLDMVEDGADELRKAPEERTVTIWTAQCFRAMLKVEFFQGLQEERRKQASALTNRVLGPLFKHVSGHSFDPTSTHDLVQEAINLSNTLNSLPGKYHMSMEDRAGHDVFIALDKLDQFDIIDVATAAPLRPRGQARAREKGSTVQRLAILVPGLVRRGEDGNEDVVLKKPTVLVHIYEPTHHPVEREGEELLDDREG
ncbi:uncharacterized protein AB675_2166 [Cyphellophora attinorum]|uniref:Uncharacterized protein n=1 Tax=Cyphellophora attinorum TaxID=1664694 RepID=A0A0N1P207_9EURO|nr:uncharacterized protein AB675_2166 [Phialophora attinorum]KPI43080.1 hypothetical protein AB675_2166 [Phialophora attinorum]